MKEITDTEILTWIDKTKPGIVTEKDGSTTLYIVGELKTPYWGVDLRCAARNAMQKGVWCSDEEDEVKAKLAKLSAWRRP